MKYEICNFCKTSHYNKNGLINSKQIKFCNNLKQYFKKYNLSIEKLKNEINNENGWKNLLKKYPIDESFFKSILRRYKIKCTKTTCKYCNKIFIKQPVVSALKKHYIWCENKYNFLTENNLNKNKLEKLYNEKGSLLELQKEYTTFSIANFYKLFNELNIDISIKKSLNNEKVKQRIRKTNLKIYGAEHNFCKNHPSRIKWQKRLLEEEGITTVFQRKEVKEKIINTLITRYGKEYWKHGYSVRGQGIISNLNKQVFNILKNNNIEFFIEFKIKRNKTRYYAYDILLKNSNKIIEINGDYWHGNPKFYKSNDRILANSNGEILVKNKWKKDEQKINFAKENNYEVLVIWENELKNNKNDTIKKILEYCKK